MPHEYPLIVTTNDGCMMHFKTRDEHIAAYGKDRLLFPRYFLPDGGLVAPSSVSLIQTKEKEVPSLTMDTSFIPQKRQRGRPAKRFNNGNVSA